MGFRERVKISTLDARGKAAILKGVDSEGALAAIALALIKDETALSAAERTLLRNRAHITDTEILQNVSEAILAGEDPLGNAFQQIRAPEIRRRQGAVYTPRTIIRAMVSWAAKAGTFDRVVDPGAGSGRFLIAIAEKFPLAEMVAVEVDPLAALILRANLTQARLIQRTQIRVGDYRWADIQEIEGRTLFIGNPPYVRHHDITWSPKAWFGRTAAKLGLKASKLAGLHVHFFLRTMELARSGDCGCFITAAEWLDVNYGAALRKALLDGLGGEALHVVGPQAAPFAGAMTSAAITCFKPGKKPKAVKIKTVTSLRELRGLRGGRKVPSAELAKLSRWSLLIKPTARPPREYIELGELFRVHRGQVTGSNDVWIVGEETPDLPRSVLFRAVTKAEEIFVCDGRLNDALRLRKVIDLPVELSKIQPKWHALVERFLEWARARGADQTYIARHRRAWYSVGLYQPAPILATYMARRPPAFARNLCAVRHVNISHGLYPRDELSCAALDTLVDWLNSNVALGYGRTYAGGLVKFEPGDLERVPVPRPETLMF